MTAVPSEVSKYMGNAVKLAAIWGSIIFNVKAEPYGAKGDGVTDDRTSIQSAINAAAANGGGTVVLPPGTYITSGQIEITASNVNIVGSGKSSIIKVKNNIAVGTIQFIFKVQAKSNNKISDLCFDGNGTNQTGTENVMLIWADRCEDIIVRDCLFKNNYGDAVVISNTRRPIITNNFFENILSDATKDHLGLVFVCDDSGYDHCHGVISGNIFKDVSMDALTLSGNDVGNIYIKYVEIVDNQFINCGWMAHDNTVAPWFDANQDAAAIYCYYAEYVNVDSNSCYLSGGNAIDFYHCRTMSVGNNTVDRSGNAGISFDYVDNTSIDGNTVTNNVTKGSTAFNVSNGYLAGITIKSNCNRIDITDNVITDNQTVKTQQYALYFLGANNNNVMVSDNNMYGNSNSNPIWINTLFSTLKVINNAGFNPRGFQIGAKSLPTGTGAGNAVTNTETFPVMIYISGGSGISIIDEWGNDVASIPGDPKVISLQPFDQVYFVTTIPSAWRWYGM